MKIATFLPNMTDVQEPEQEELNENHIPPKLRALPVSAVLYLAKPRRMGKARKKIITPLRSLRKNLATLAVPYLPSSVPKSPLAPRTKGYRPQLRSSDFLLPYFLICLLYPYMPYMVKKLWGLGYLAPEPVEGSLSKGACRREPVEGSLSKGACRREPVEGSLFYLTQSCEGGAENAKKISPKLCVSPSPRFPTQTSSHTTSQSSLPAPP